MNDSYKLLAELLDNCLSFSGEDCELALIEKEIVLEKIRDLYVKVSNLDTVEFVAGQYGLEDLVEKHKKDNDKNLQEKSEKKEQKNDYEEKHSSEDTEIKEITTNKASSDKTNPELQADLKPEVKKVEENENKAQPEIKFTPAKTLDEDVDLFFDTEHESYEATDISKELDAIAAEIETNEIDSEATGIKVSEPADGNDEIFENLDIDTEIVVNNEITDDTEELFPDEDFQINVAEEKTPAAPQKNSKKDVQPIQPEIEEDDILQFAQAQKKTETPKVQAASQRSLNDLFNESREDKSISGQFQRAKVGDLTKAISINDKFIYIKELFHNRGEDFSDSIRQLNKCKNLNEAFDCLEQLKQKYYWDSTSDAYLSFCDLLRRKHS